MTEPSPTATFAIPGTSDAVGDASASIDFSAELAPHAQPDTARATWQVVNSVGGYLLAWVLMYFAVDISWWLAAPLAVVAAGLFVRIFIIMHDCGHGSFLQSRRGNDIIGVICGAVSYTPYFRWRWEHARHHATSGNLESRGIGDIWTMTVAEYQQASRWERFSYRLIRNPLALLSVGPFWLTLVRERIPIRSPNCRARHSVWWTNLFMVVVLAIGVLAFGWVDFLLLQLIIISISGAAGIWLFYIQHQFEDAYWVNAEAWKSEDAALRGSSFYKLPKVLQWFSGNIGFHHIHHLSPRIPNYRLERCHDTTEAFLDVPVVTLRSSMHALSLRLWDERAGKLVGFDQAR